MQIEETPAFHMIPDYMFHSSWPLVSSLPSSFPNKMYTFLISSMATTDHKNLKPPWYVHQKHLVKNTNYEASQHASDAWSSLGGSRYLS